MLYEVTSFVVDESQLRYTRTNLTMTSANNKKGYIESHVFNREWCYKYSLFSFDALCDLLDETVSISDYIEWNGMAIGEMGKDFAGSAVKHRYTDPAAMLLWWEALNVAVFYGTNFIVKRREVWGLSARMKKKESRLDDFCKAMHVPLY